MSHTSRFDAHVAFISRREADFGHGADARVRGRLLAEIESEANVRTLFRDETHQVLGLDDGMLDKGRLTTDRIQAALDAIRALPNIEMNISGRHQFMPLTVLP